MQQVDSRGNGKGRGIHLEHRALCGSELLEAIISPHYFVNDNRGIWIQVFQKEIPRPISQLCIGIKII